MVVTLVDNGLLHSVATLSCMVPSPLGRIQHTFCSKSHSQFPTFCSQTPVTAGSTGTAWNGKFTRHFYTSSANGESNSEPSDLQPITLSTKPQACQAGLMHLILLSLVWLNLNFQEGLLLHEVSSKNAVCWRKEVTTVRQGWWIRDGICFDHNNKLNDIPPPPHHWYVHVHDGMDNRNYLALVSRLYNIERGE